LTHLRFTPAEYNAIAHVRHRLDLTTFDVGTIRLILVLSLLDDMPLLSDRVRRLKDNEIRLLRDHLRTEGTTPPRRPFSAEEWHALAEACRGVPAGARFARPFQPALVRHFRKASPSLARKLARLSVTQFVQIFEQAQEQQRGVE
jgi:hypothetical protein